LEPQHEVHERAHRFRDRVLGMTAARDTGDVLGERDSPYQATDELDGGDRLPQSPARAKALVCQEQR
jgi:hypothetical protein